MKLYDCFPFFAELDLLELRLNELSGVVDRFVLVEARQTYNGEPKPLHYAENKDRFAAFADRIEHIVVDAFPKRTSRFSHEVYQRHQLERGLTGAEPEDLVMLSDLDEIVRPEILAGIKADPPGYRDLLCFELRYFYFFLNLERKETWLRIGPRLMRRKRLKRIEVLRGIRAPAGGIRDLARGARAAAALGFWPRRRVVRDAGWHFTWLGGVAAVARKSAAIPEHNNHTKLMKDPEAARPLIAAAINDPAFCEITRIDDSYPAHIRQNPDRYAHLVLTPGDGPLSPDG